MPRVNLFGDTGESWNDSISASECVNMVPFLSNTKNTLVFDTMPGLETYYETATGTDEIQAVFLMPNSSFSGFAARTFFLKSSSGVTTVNTLEDDLTTVNVLGTFTSPGIEGYAFAYDKSETGGKLLIIANLSVSYAEITLNNDPASDSLSMKSSSIGFFNNINYFDGYFFVNVTDSNNSHRIHSTDFGTTTFSSLNYGDITTKAGEIIRIEEDKRELWVFCEHHIEVWYNAGSSGFPLLRNPSVVIDIGLYARDSLVNFNGSMIFFGKNEVGKIGVYQLSGYSVEDITPGILKRDISEANSNYSNIKSSIARAINLNNFQLYVWSYTGASQGTYAYNLNSGLWNKEESDSLSVSNYGRWTNISSSSLFTFGTNIGQLNIVVADKTSSVTENRIDVYRTEANYEPSDAGVKYKNFVMKSNFIQGEDNNQAIHKRLQIKFNPINTTLTLKVEFSDDEEVTWDVVGTFDISDTTKGLIDLYALGASRKRIYRITSVMGAVFTGQLTLTDAWLELEQLNS